jgi:glycosidase
MSRRPRLAVSPLERKSMAGDAIDLATENQVVRDYLNAAIEHYLDMGVDAIRLDTLKHVERGDVLTYVNHWKAHKPDLFVFGENLVKGTGFGQEITNDNASAVIRPWWYTRLTTDPANPSGGPDSGLSVLDFSLFSTFRDNIRNGNFSGVGGVLAFDWLYGDATKLVTFFQNHDVGPDNDFKFRFGAEARSTSSATASRSCATSRAARATPWSASPRRRPSRSPSPACATAPTATR